MIPFIMIAFVIAYIISNYLVRNKSFTKILKKIYPWIMVVLVVVGVGISMSVKKTAEDGNVDASGIPVYDWCINELAVWLVTCPFYFVDRSKEKKRKLAQDKPHMDNLTLVLDTVTRELPEGVTGRVKIVEKFNERYSLNLTEAQIKSIVDGSFMSLDWAKEVRAMDRKYASESEWYAGDTDWLRAYLKAFNVQNISTDFEMQKEYCLSNFKEVFTSVDPARYGDVPSYIKAINNQFFTNFDDASFMVAHRFVRRNGVAVELPKAGLIRATSEIDTLASKYEQM